MPRKPSLQHRNVCLCYSEYGSNHGESFGASLAPLFLSVHFPKQALLAEALSINRSGMHIACRSGTITA